MGTYIYENGHINSIQPYYVMLNGQRYNAAHFNGRIVFGITEEVQPAPALSTPFYVEDISGNTNEIIFYKGTVAGPSITIEKSTNGTNWVSAGVTIMNGLHIQIPANTKMYFRCQTDAWSHYRDGFVYGDNYIEITHSCNIGGNINSLLYGSSFNGQAELPSYVENHTFQGFFESAPIVNAENLLLPATTLVDWCYTQLFIMCTSLVKAPELPATTLAEYCYSQMFAGCTSLVKAPELPATTLVQGCYDYMLSGCANLNYVKCLAINNLSAANCTANWLDNVSATGTFYKAAGTTWPTGTSGIPTGWTVVEV